MFKSDKIEICEATTSDAERLRALAVKCKIDAWSVSDYAEEISRPDSIVVKAVSEDRLVGFAVSKWTFITLRSKMNFEGRERAV